MNKKGETKQAFNEEVGDDTQLESTDLMKELNLSLWPKKPEKGTIASMWRNPLYDMALTFHSQPSNARAFNNLLIASITIITLPLLSIFFICKTDVVVGPEVDLDTRLLLAGGVAAGFVVFVMIGIVVVALLEPEPEWAKKHNEQKQRLKKK